MLLLNTRRALVPAVKCSLAPLPKGARNITVKTRALVCEAKDATSICLANQKQEDSGKWPSLLKEWFHSSTHVQAMTLSQSVPLFMKQSEANILLLRKIFLWKFHGQSQKRYVPSGCIKVPFSLFAPTFLVKKKPLLVNKFKFTQAERRLINFHVIFQPIYTENSEISFHYRNFSSTRRIYSGKMHELFTRFRLVYKQ